MTQSFAPNASSAIASALTGAEDDSLARCISEGVGARREEAMAAASLGVHRVPTFIVGQRESSGRIVGWVVEGLRDSVLLETIREVAQLLKVRPAGPERHN